MDIHLPIPRGIEHGAQKPAAVGGMCLWKQTGGSDDI